MPVSVKGGWPETQDKPVFSIGQENKVPRRAKLRTIANASPEPAQHPLLRDHRQSPANVRRSTGPPGKRADEEIAPPNCGKASPS